MKVLWIILLLALPLSSFAFEKGKSVNEIYTDANGNKISITVTPPKDRVVNPNYFSSIENERWRLLNPKHRLALSGSIKPINVSGYQVNISRVGEVSSGCKPAYQLAQKIPVTLDPGMQYTVSGSYSEDIQVTAWPISGRLRVGTLYGSKVCQRLTTAKLNRLKLADCYFPGCFNDRYVLSAVFVNPTSSTVTEWVGAVTTFFINP